MTSAAAVWAPVDLPAVPPVPPPDVQVVWKGADGNYASGRSGRTVVALVIHTMGGTLAGTDSWFNNPAAQVSSQYGVGLQGQAHQYVALTDTAWANGVLEPGNKWTGIVGNSSNPNPQSVSIETEDNGSGSTPVTDAMYNTVLALGHRALQAYPSIRYLMGHNIVSPNSRSQCCGDRWWKSGRFQSLADALGLQACY